MKKIIFLTSFLFITSLNGQSYYSKFKDLSKPKKWWVLSLSLKAKKAFKISQEAKIVADSVRKTKTLGKISSGSKVDAFRHAFWMAYLGQNIGIKAARALGKAHEKEGYLHFQENKLEDGILPDEPSMKMDLFNNDVGLSLVEKDNKKSKNELIKEVIKAVEEGKMLIIKRDKKRRYLTCEGKLIAKESLYNKWENDKCLIHSNAL